MGAAVGNGRRTLSEEAPPGYKRTEAGVIPKDWEIVALRDIIEKFVNGGTPSTKNADFWSGNIPWITGADILNQTVAVIRRYITEEAVRNSPTNVIARGNLLIVSRTGVGKLAIAPCDIAISQDFTGVIPNKEKVLAKYLLWHFDFYQHVLAKQNQGTSIKGITRDTLAVILLLLPPLPEQTAIAEALSDVDGLLSALEALVAKKRAIKQAAMQQLLTGKTRLPGFSGDWERKTLGELEQRGDIGLFRGRVISQKDIDRLPGDYPIYSSSVHLDGLFGSYGDYMFDEELITWSVDGGGHFFYRPQHRFSVTNVCGYLRIRTSSIDYRYLAYHLQNLHSRKVFDYTVKAHPSVIRNSYNVALPQYNEQTAIAAVLSDMDAEIAALEHRRDKARTIKQGMMQQLLTGRVRLI